MPRYQACSVCGRSIVWVGSYGLGEPRPYVLDPSGGYVYDAAEGGMRRVAGGVAVDEERFVEHWPCPDIPVQRAPAHDTLAPVVVTLVPHTHWDREWYAPFQTYRLRLVDLVDRLLDVLESGPLDPEGGFSHFLLDGQTAALDDYLEVRPENTPRVRALARTGRLAAGPWTTLPDEFMVSGETLVRNLQHGIARATDLLGGPMPVGYSPDSFGHVAQLPQILRLLGIGHALVWRGVPLAIDTTAFRWEAPDGSHVRAEYLPHGYSQGWRVPGTAGELLARIADYDAATARQRLGGLLIMAGGDHMKPNPALPAAVAEANNTQRRYALRIGSLADYLKKEPSDGLPVWRGELRSSGRHSVIMGVTSNRMDVKVACAAAERAVERLAEPLSAVHLPPRGYPRRLLDLAWHRLVLNAAHDSACACSHDEVVAEVLDRYAQARQIGSGLAERAVAALATAVDAPSGATVVANPSGHPLTATVRVPVTGAGPWQLTDASGRALASQSLPVAAEPLADYVATLADVEMLAAAAGDGRVGEWPITRAVVDDGDATVVVTLTQAAPDEPLTDLTPVWSALRDLRQRDPARGLRWRVLPAPVCEVVGALAEPVPGFGWSAFRAARGDGARPSSAGGSVVVGPTSLDNGLLHVEVDATSGTWSVTTADGVAATGLGRLVDGGDGGDTYNWSPPEADRLVETPDDVRVEAVAGGPVVGRLRVVATYPWPLEAVGDSFACTARSATTVVVPVETLLEVRHGEPFVRVRTSWDNTVRDHRLRVHLPLPARVSGSAAESAYAVVDRGLTHEGNPYEAALPTYPARRFVDCSDGNVGLAVVHDGVFEYEVVDDGTELAVTLVRSVGYLSRAGMRLRPGPAGPYVPIAGGQVPGRNVRRYAVVPHRGDWRAADLYAVADAVLLDPLVAPVGDRPSATASLPPHGTRLAVDGAAVCAVLRDDDGALLVRLLGHDPAGGTARVLVDGRPARGRVVDLSGADRGPFDGMLRLRPWQITTVRVRLPALPGTTRSSA